jgi:periplasmic copper chaperone A
MMQAQRGLSSTRRPGPAAADVLALLLALFVAPGIAAAAPAAVTLSQPWMRFLTPQIPAAGYFTLRNGGTQPVTLTGAASPDCAQLMLHRSVTTNGTAEMEMVKSVVVPAHGAVTFRPGGYHLMCMSPAAAIAPGHSVPVSLQFSDGSSLSANFPVYGAKGK